MSYKEQMEAWLKDNPDATVEQAWEAGYDTCTMNWLHGKREKLERFFELMKEILS